MMEKTLERRGQRLLKGKGDDVDIPSPLLFSPNDDDDNIATQDKFNEIKIGPMTKARAK
jgi:hypothetical protein